jgi:ATP-dependent DNA ligase
MRPLNQLAILHTSLFQMPGIAQLRQVLDHRPQLHPESGNLPCRLFGAFHVAERREFIAEGAVVFAKACELGLEGIVSKRAGSFYRNGRSRNWLKTVNQDFVRK